MPNQLLNETSPYLLQHAHNPVDWLPWTPEAFAKAKAADKPVLVSIGYAACHWCHVMERESFENESIARKMNNLLISIKVDREERPDIDAIYMEAMQRMHGHGGWPLNVFLLPDGRPFYAGTYFPPNDRPGIPSWPRVIDAVADAYHSRRDSVLENARILTDSIRTSAHMEMPNDPLNPTTPDDASRNLASIFDPEHGGFGGAPKFPQSMPLEFLLRYHARTSDQNAREIVEISLQKMASGGIYDHLAGGFARYSTDALWLVPHFEKMLYDNALLASLYTQAHQAAGDPRYRRIAEETLDYLLRNLQHPAGAFFSSQDADSEGVEGKFYVWSQNEIERLLGNDAPAFIRCYGVTPHGNFEGRNILFNPDSIPSAAADLGIPYQELAQRLPAMRQTLLQARAKRIPPATDDKALAGWNALALRALSEAAFAFDRPDYLRAAQKNASFLLRELRPNGRLLRVWKNGRARIPAYLEDYALLINALISLHSADFSHQPLAHARQLANDMINLFWSNSDETFYDVGADHDEQEKLIVRPRQTSDNALPCGGSAAAEALLRLASLTGSEDYAAKAERLLRGVAPLASRHPLGFGNWLRAIELRLAQPTEIVITGDPSHETTRALLAPLRSRYLPTAIFLGLPPDDPHYFPSPLSEGRTTTETPTAYVCHGYACDLPTSDPNALADLLDQ